MDDIAKKKFYSYLLMRSVDRRGRVKTTAVGSDSWLQYSSQIIGLCDLDHDGWAEVVTTGGGIDAADTTLFHWNGHRFLKGGGYGWGC